MGEVAACEGVESTQQSGADASAEAMIDSFLPVARCVAVRKMGVPIATPDPNESEYLPLMEILQEAPG